MLPLSFILSAIRRVKPVHLLILSLWSYILFDSISPHSLFRPSSYSVLPSCTCISQEKTESATLSFESAFNASGLDKTFYPYGSMYGSVFDPLKFNKVNILIITTLRGADLKLWKSFFPYAKILYISKLEWVDEFKSEAEDKRVELIQGDVMDDFFMMQIIVRARSAGLLDFIIDDGSHIVSHQIRAFNYLAQLLKQGGYYFIEDLQTSYYECNGTGANPLHANKCSECCGGGPPGKEGTMIDGIKSCIDAMNRDFFSRSIDGKQFNLGEYSVNPSDKLIASVQCWRGLCALERA